MAPDMDENTSGSADEKIASEAETGEYVPPEIEERGELNEVTQGGSSTGSLDASYPQGTSSSFDGGLFS